MAMAIILIDGERALLLSHVPSELRKRNVPLSDIRKHRKLREMCNDGTLVPPCELLNDRFWAIRTSRLPELAHLLGLSLEPEPEQITSPRLPAGVGEEVPEHNGGGCRLPPRAADPHRRVDSPRRAAA
jgi:hypothetical protein